MAWRAQATGDHAASPLGPMSRIRSPLSCPAYMWRVAFGCDPRWGPGRDTDGRRIDRHPGSSAWVRVRGESPRADRGWRLDAAAVGRAHWMGRSTSIAPANGAEAPGAGERIERAPRARGDLRQ